MEYKVTLPEGVKQKSVFFNDASVEIFDGQIVRSNALAEKYPSIFKKVNIEKAELTITPKETEVIVPQEELLVEVPVEAEAEEELLIETPSREVEVEIVAETPDYNNMTIKELKALAAEKGVELYSNKKKDIIASLKA